MDSGSGAGMTEREGTGPCPSLILSFDRLKIN